jgi:uncharacterized membrane protein
MTKEILIFQNSNQEVVKGIVQKIIERIEPAENNDDYVPLYMQSTRIKFEAKITSGRQKGHLITAVQNMGEQSENSAREIKTGDRILLISFDNNGQWNFNGFLRSDKLFILGIIFVLCLLLIGRKKGFNSILSLGLSTSVILGVFIPSILSGKNIYLMTILVFTYIIVMTFLIVLGYNRKSLVAVLGCSSGIAVSSIIILIMDKVLFLSGIVDERTGYIAALPIENPINLGALIFACIIIGSLGAITDMAMSITSSLWEVRENSKNIEFKILYKSGMAIRRDMMGTMVNTLILAYIGSSLSTVIILAIYDNSFLNLLNSELIVVSILQALVGTLGILVTMPLTALFCSIFYMNKTS